MLNFTTFFDTNYLSKGITLFNSLKKHTKEPFKVYLLCLDENIYDFFVKNKSDFQFIELITLSEIENTFTELKLVKKNRSLIEYYFTLSPILPLYLLTTHNLDHICSMDADLFFYSNPVIIFDKLNQFSIIITPHKFSNELNERRKYGLYNVSFQLFKNNIIGINCLNKWKSDCINWCSDIYDEINQRFADQKYLDNWVNLYQNSVLILDGPSTGLAVWNINNYNLNFYDDTFISNNEKVIFYHFHNFKLLTNNIFLNGFYNYKVKRNQNLDFLYEEYFFELKNNINKYRLIPDQFIRSNKNKIISNILEECSFYIFKNKIIHINFKFIPKIIRKVIIKIYG